MLTVLSLNYFAFANSTATNTLLENIFCGKGHPEILEVHHHITNWPYCIIVLEETVEITCVANIVQANWLIRRRSLRCNNRVRVTDLCEEKIAVS